MKFLTLALLTLLVPTIYSIRVFSNPVIPDKNLPDPGAIFHNGNYYVVNTADASSPGKFQIHKSADLQTWDYASDVFPADQLPSWAVQDGSFWAPELHIVNGVHTVIFAAEEKASGGLMCIGIGTADDIVGPYKDSGAPVIKNTTVGSIDGSIMTVDNNTYYVLWKDTGNSHDPILPTWLKAQLLNSDGVTVSGEVHYLIRNTLPWEARITEAPWVIQRKNYYYLFYSGHDYCDDTYAVGVARSTSPLGPYEKKGEPILKSNAGWKGPGHCSVLQEDGQGDTWVMVYHSWIAGQVCTGYKRVLMVDYMYWADEWPYMKGSSPTSGNWDSVFLGEKYF